MPEQSTHHRNGQKRVLFLGHGAERTGPPIMLDHLLRGLAGQYSLSVLTARSGALTDSYARSGAEVHDLGTNREPLEQFAAALRRVGGGRVVPALQNWRRRQVTERIAPPDLVYVNAATPPTAALLRALRPPPQTPVLLHVHELDVGLRMTLDPQDRHLLFERADQVVAASDAVADLLRAEHDVDPALLTVCPEFVNVDALATGTRAGARIALDLPPDALAVGSVGLPDWRKDPERMLHAIHRLRARRPELDPWAIWIGGERTSVDGRRLADEAARLGMAHRFRHVEHCDRPHEMARALDVFALPAREDALPLAALEAAAIGLPLVCFRTGGVAALCDDGAGIAVVYPDVVAFADAMEQLLDDESRRASVGERGAELVADHHDLDVGVARIRAAIDGAFDLTDEPA